jgi:UDP-4-amino-4,6-dideoxy-N-acetyl-beta-L-altrosamine N-acetyltransferase
MKIELINLKDIDYNLQLEVRNWRNAEHVAKYFQIDYIDEETHNNWLKSLKEERPQNIAFLIKVDKDFVGLVYFLKIDYFASKTHWGMYIYDQNLRGLGIGKEVIKWTIQYAKETMKMKSIRLEVLKNNIYAIKLYEKIGFKYSNYKNENVLYYELNLYENNN